MSTKLEVVDRTIMGGIRPPRPIPAATRLRSLTTPRGPRRVRGWLPGAVTAVVGVALLIGAVAATVAEGREAVQSNLDNALGSDASLHASALREYFDRAKTIDLLLADDRALTQLQPGTGASASSTNAKISAEGAAAMAYLEKLYPGRISEACLIDTHGVELARVVQGRIAPASELSSDEAHNSFFAKTLALPKGRVYQAAPYVSDDTHEWVISNSTPMVSSSGRTWGLAHFEIALSTFALDEEGTDSRFTDLIVDNRTGRILLDGERGLVGTDELGVPASTEMQALVEQAGVLSTGTVDGRRVASARVPVGPDNANSWSVVVIAPEGVGGWSSSITPASVATALAALLLLAFGGVILLRSRRTERQGEARYRALIDQSSDLVLVTDRSGGAHFISPSVERLLGLVPQPPRSHAPVPGGPDASSSFDLLAAVDPRDRDRLAEALRSAAPGRMAAGEFRVMGRNGTASYEISVQDLTADPSVAGLVVTGHDVTERLELNQQLEHRSLHDGLTGLPNRTLLAERFTQALSSSEHSGTSVGLLLLDLDRFKEVNDTFGHHYGDELLRQIGARLQGALRTSDTVARLGGDEFAVLLPVVGDLEDATTVAKALREALAKQFHVAGVVLDVEASIGVAVSAPDSRDPIALMRHADVAMYVAKVQRLGVSVYDPSVDGHSATRLALVGELRRAIDCGELVLHYQPKVRIDTGEVVGAEALVRWQHPEQGMVYPDEFIPMAEHTGLINPLTRHILDLALAQVRVWLEAGREMCVSVNVSARNLHDEQLPDTVAELLAWHEVPAHLLELEVTESAIMVNPQQARVMLEKLSALGLSLSLDDFGAGYTSLSQLTTMPIDEIKIDRAFVMAMVEDPGNALIVTSVIELGHSLGKTMVAEGVEDATALSALADFGCDVAQGYHMSRPIPLAEFDAWCVGRPVALHARPGELAEQNRS